MRQAAEVGQWLAGHAEPIDLALVSPARRTQSTWDLVAAELDRPPPARVDDRLYAATSVGLLAVLGELSDELATVVLVGHNPTVEDLVERLTGELVAMPTSAIAVIDLPRPWAHVGEDRAVLRTSGRPPR
jgi:phosphohistidine phosphatase